MSDHNRTSVSRSHSQVPVCASCSARSSAARPGHPREASRLSVPGSAPALRRARRRERCRVLGFGGMGFVSSNDRKRGLLEYALTRPRSARHVRHVVVATETRTISSRSCSHREVDLAPLVRCQPARRSPEGLSKGRRHPAASPLLRTAPGPDGAHTVASATGSHRWMTARSVSRRTGLLR